MCGFVGFRNTPEVASPENVVKAMADRIIHRGTAPRCWCSTGRFTTFSPCGTTC